MHECPKEVIEAGKELIKLRKYMSKARDQIAVVKEALAPATEVMVKEHGAKHMDGSEALKMLSDLEAATYLADMAHNCNRKVLCDCGVAEPTDDQVLGFR